MQTPVESLIEALLPYIDRSRISDTALQNIIEEHVVREREQALRDMMQADEDSGLYQSQTSTKKKHTAVEWLIEQLDNTTIFSKYVFLEIIEQAKAMEKEQITAAYRVGKVEANLPPEKLTTGEQYYNETFKSE